MALIDGGNSAVPDSIAEAIYLASDHYPVVAKIAYTTNAPVGAFAKYLVILPVGSFCVSDTTQATNLWDDREKAEKLFKEKNYLEKKLFQKV